MGKNDLLWIGSAFWLMGTACILGGISQYAWMPFFWGGFALGYRAALNRTGDPVSSPPTPESDNG